MVKSASCKQQSNLECGRVTMHSAFTSTVQVSVRVLLTGRHMS